MDYSNTRDFSDKIAGDVAPEGLNFVSADSVTRLLKAGIEITKDNKFAPKDTLTKAELTNWMNSLLK